MEVIADKNFTRYTRAVDLKRVDFIVKNLKKSIPDTGTVLDVGCGNGNISMQLGGLGYMVQGVDVSDKAIKKAKETNTFSNVLFDVISAEQLVADGKKYDAVICSEVLEHLEEPEKLVATLHDLISDNGILIVTVPNGTGPREVLMTKPMQKMRDGNGALWKFTKGIKSMLGYSGTTVQSDADNLDHIQFFTHKDLYRMADNNGFKIVEFGHADWMEDIFPYSFLSKRIHALQRLDCQIADKLPHGMVGGFQTVWVKK
ncbi:MAG: methyltransferase domain-containing protein [Cyclobacteriaceae bacterium]